DDIRVEYHPHAEKEPEVTPFSQFSREHFSKPQIDEESLDPWHPFRSRLDFEVAELALDALMTKEQTSRLIKLIRRVADHREDFHIQDYKDLRQTWDAAGKRVTPFRREVISVNYAKEPEPRQFDFWHRPLWDWATDLLKDPRTGPHFHFDAQRLSKFDGELFVRFIDEPWTADDFWSFQNRIPENAKPFAIILYADKAKLSTFGTQKAYPIIARCANLPASIRNGTGFAGGRVVGWLPIVKEDPKQKKKVAWSNFKNAVWHESFRVFLEEIAIYAKTGRWVKCWDDIERWFFPIILILSADFEEQSVMALTRGVNAKRPCPVCKIPRNLLYSHQEWPRRVAEQTDALLKHARSLSRKERDEVLLHAGIRNVNNAFNTVEGTDVHKALSFDPLHANKEGMFGYHLWPIVQKEVHALGRDAAATVDNNFDLMPRWRNFHHFDHVIDVAFNDGEKHGDISKALTFTCHTVLTHHAETGPNGHLLLRLVRAYVEFDMWLTLDVHTDVTLAAGQKSLDALADLTMVYIRETAAESEKDWNFPKNHTRDHSFKDIIAKGVTRGFDAKPNERMHGIFRRIYHGTTNFKNIIPQILKVEHDLLTCLHIRELLDDHDAIYEAELEPLSSSTVIVTGPLTSSFRHSENSLHIRIGSRQKAVSFEDVETTYANDAAFERFRIKTYEFLNILIPSIGRLLPGARRVQYKPQDKASTNLKFTYGQIVEFRYMKVNYESKVDWCLHSDYLRCSPDFFGGPRYDCVIINTERRNIFGRLLFLFECIVEGQTYQLALVLPYDAAVGARSAADRDLNFWRVRSQPRRCAEIFSVESFVRGAALALDPSMITSDEYLVVDTVDSDMFLRMQHMHESAGHQRYVFSTTSSILIHIVIYRPAIPSA
ncbi:hypothetical protein CONPUDRAFT_49167, partial [Coniophora puteana RWD-64-598 SS2]